MIIAFVECNNYFVCTFFFYEYIPQTIVNIYDLMIIVLDDNWENCYGDAEFDQTDNKFPDAKGMIKTIKDVLGFRVTLWIHPFVNLECSSWKNSIIPPIFQPYVKDKKGQKGIGNLPGLVYWWQGKNFPQKIKILLILHIFFFE